MKNIQITGIFLEIFLVVTVLGVLTAIAIPQVSQMMNNNRVESWEEELRSIQTAVTAMLDDSASKTLEPVGPTRDIRRVHTRDTPPLVLSDYLPGAIEDSPKLSCSYIFSANGTIRQFLP